MSLFREIFVLWIVSGHQSGMMANPARGQLKEENRISVPFAPDSLVLRVRFGCPVRCQRAHFPYESGVGFKFGRMFMFLYCSIIMCILHPTSSRFSISNSRCSYKGFPDFQGNYFIMIWASCFCVLVDVSRRRYNMISKHFHPALFSMSVIPLVVQ